jgi:hypothetical protein
MPSALAGGTPATQDKANRPPSAGNPRPELRNPSRSTGSGQALSSVEGSETKPPFSAISALSVVNTKNAKQSQSTPKGVGRGLGGSPPGIGIIRETPIGL